MYDIFLAMLLNEKCPLRRIKRGRTRFPKKQWITQGILNFISWKNELYKIYLCETFVINFQQFNICQNTSNGFQWKAEKLHLQNEFMKHKYDIKKNMENDKFTPRSKG